MLPALCVCVIWIMAASLRHRWRPLRSHLRVLRISAVLLRGCLHITWSVEARYFDVRWMVWGERLIWLSVRMMKEQGKC